MTKTLTIAVCVATRNRQVMLGALLGSLAEIETPEASELAFVVVENDDQNHTEATVDAHRPGLGTDRVHYVLEPELGIPFARNAAARKALKIGADLIVFVDDDETVAGDWLINLVAAYRRDDGVLIGGPVSPRFEGDAPSTLVGWVRSGLEARAKRLSSRAAGRAAAGQAERVTVITSNWLGEAALFTEHGIWFDIALRMTGGSDTQFFRDVRAKGLKTGWAGDAWVYETIPDERVSMRYQFVRGMEQSKTAFHAKIRKQGRLKVLPVFLGTLGLRLITLVLSVLTIPFVGTQALISIPRNAGWLAGRVMAFMGSRSTLYAETTGS